MPEEALTSFTVFDAYRYFVGQAYRVVQITDTLCFVRLNFIKYRPIFKLISLSESAEHL